MANHIVDLTGQRFGRLTVVEIAYRKRDQQGDMRIFWSCKCDCGNTCIVSRNNLRKGSTKSCGCLREEVSHKGKTHGMYGTRINRIWNGMKSRCSYSSCQDYKYYGGKGVTYCEEWKNFSSFYEWAMENGYQDGMSLERIDVNGNYEPSNCKWVSPREQRYNMTTSLKFTIDGETKCLAEWCELYNISYQTVYKRLKVQKLGIYEALTKPIKARKGEKNG